MFVTEAFQVVFLVSPVFEDFDVQVQEYFFPEEGFDVNTGFRADFFQRGSLMPDNDAFLIISVTKKRAGISVISSLSK